MQKVCWFTDIHSNYMSAAERKRIYEQMRNVPADIILITGDIADALVIAEELASMAEVIQKPIYFVLGNHDYYHGNVAEVREKMQRLCTGHRFLHWLPQAGGVLLDENTLLVGQDSWADARLGDFQNSDVVLTDSRLIGDLAASSASGGREQLLSRMRALADVDAAALDQSLTSNITPQIQRVIILTHVPPFEGACWDQGSMISNPSLRPFFTSKIIGDVILRVAQSHPTTQFLVLCGHTHFPGVYRPAANVLARTGKSNADLMLSPNRLEYKIISTKELYGEESSLFQSRHKKLVDQHFIKENGGRKMREGVSDIVKRLGELAQMMTTRQTMMLAELSHQKEQSEQTLRSRSTEMRSAFGEILAKHAGLDHIELFNERSRMFAKKFFAETHFQILEGIPPEVALDCLLLEPRLIMPFDQQAELMKILAECMISYSQQYPDDPQPLDSQRAGEGTTEQLAKPAAENTQQKAQIIEKCRKQLEQNLRGKKYNVDTRLVAGADWLQELQAILQIATQTRLPAAAAETTARLHLISASIQDEQTRYDILVQNQHAIETETMFSANATTGHAWRQVLDVLLYNKLPGGQVSLDSRVVALTVLVQSKFYEYLTTKSSHYRVKTLFACRASSDSKEYLEAKAYVFLNALRKALGGGEVTDQYPFLTKEDEEHVSGLIETVMKQRSTHSASALPELANSESAHETTLRTAARA